MNEPHRQEIDFEQGENRYTATVADDPIPANEVVDQAFIVEHSSATYAIFVDVGEPGGYIARRVEGVNDGVGQLDRGRCREKICNAPILWVKREDSGKAVALNPEPDEGGNIILVPGMTVKPVARQLTGYLLVEAVRQPRYRVHFATCPGAERFRKKRAKEQT